MINYSGQIVLVLISIIFTSYQKFVGHDDFFTIDFFIFTTIAWLVGWQFDKARYYEKKANANVESYKQLLDSLPEAVFIHEKHTIIYINKAAVHLMGAQEKEQLIGESILNYIDKEYKERFKERLRQAKKEKHPIHSCSYKLRRLDQSSFFFEESSLSINFGEKQALLTIGKDITTRKEETERLLQKSEKLAIVGQMAAGIAHEIRNPLTSIKGFIQLLKTHPLEEKHFNIVFSELDRIDSILGEFLILAKPSATIYKEQDIKGLMTEVVTLISTQSILNNIEIHTSYDTELTLVNCEKNQVKQVFINLLKNSIEAMPNGGEINVSIMEKEEGKVSISIVDQGKGIPEERISSLGEPFYTTKEKGTGLGLMTCFKIIESHEGRIFIESKVNQGTTIEIIMPTVTQPMLKSG
ncbi:ATP-binding protein [Bacillus pinisoli]|uniref:ATP-binding protein n=1 Tax=Bacillus pinisoli TaxID=2901866 RepID=UPI001FF273AA|nr:ATP-binding protein [Bacillus pinisoli]